MATTEIVGAQVTFIKKDVNLWPKHNPWITPEQARDGFVMAFQNGQEVLFAPTSDGRALKADRNNSSGYEYWTKLPYGEIVEAEIL